MPGHLLTSDPITRKKTVWHDQSDGGAVIQAQQDIEPVLKMNKEERKEAGKDFSGEMVKVASIPVAVYEDLMRRGIADNPERFKRWLNDPDNEPFRTRRGRV